MPGPLLETKLHVPRRRRNLVARARLRVPLDADAAVTLVSAPAGFGKTTLVADWVGGLDAHVAWVSLDERDDEPTRFWTYVATALGPVGEGALAELSAAAVDLDAALAVLVNDLSRCRPRRRGPRRHPATPGRRRSANVQGARMSHRPVARVAPSSTWICGVDERRGGRRLRLRRRRRVAPRAHDPHHRLPGAGVRGLGAHLHLSRTLRPRPAPPRPSVDGGLEELDEVPRGVDHQHLGAARAPDDLVAEGHPFTLEAGDLGRRTSAKAGDASTWGVKPKWRV